ncbi:MAG: hypothetical protein IJ418_18190 [Clostridia bacterium]|nr:hypothetical protein [Clostridia bacterium]
MEEKIWTRPEVSVVEFAAGDFCVSACSAAYSGQLVCSLPGEDPNKIGDWSSGENYQEPNGWQGVGGSSNHGSCADTAENKGLFYCQGNTSYGWEDGNIANANIFNVQIGAQVNDPYNPIESEWIVDDASDTTPNIGTLQNELNQSSIGKWFKALWTSTDSGNGKYYHAGYANIHNVLTAGNPNHS